MLVKKFALLVGAQIFRGLYCILITFLALTAHLLQDNINGLSVVRVGLSLHVIP